MLNLICPQHCPSPFCETACPAGAITISAKDKNVYVDTDKCNRCGICRVVCMTFSRDKVFEGKRPWVSSDWAMPRVGR